jgi:hypothetical protein
VGSYAVTPSGLSSSNYTISYVSGTLTVTPASLTVTVNGATRAYGAEDPGFTVSYSNFANGDSPRVLGGALVFSTAATAASPVGLYAVTPSGLCASNYAITYVSGTLTVTPAPLTVTAEDATKVYGAANPAFTATYSGFVNGDTASSLGGTLGFSTPATTPSPVGSYAVTPSGLSSSNYTISFISGTLAITPARLTVTASSATKVYGQSNPAFTVSYAGLVNGDTASALGGVPRFATLASASCPVGSYAVTPSGLSSSNYTISYIAGTLTITPASLTVTADDATRVYGQPNPAFTASYSGLVNGDTAGSLGGTLGFSTPAAPSSAVGSYAVTPAGLTSSNYTIAYVSGTLTVTPAPLTVTANNASKVYGQSNPAFTASYVGLVNGDTASALGGTLDFGTAATASSPVGMYVVTSSGLTTGNYTISYVSGSLTVMPAAVTVTADDASAVYGQPPPTFTASYSGLVNGDTARALGGTLGFSTVATAASPVGAYTVRPSGLGSGNYTISYVSGTLSITPAPLT